MKILLNNVGREGHTYYKHIYDNYDNLICYFDKGLKYIIDIYNKNNINYSSFIIPINTIKIKYNITIFSFTNIPTLLTVIYNL